MKFAFITHGHEDSGYAMQEAGDWWFGRDGARIPFAAKWLHAIDSVRHCKRIPLLSSGCLHSAVIFLDIEPLFRVRFCCIFQDIDPPRPASPTRMVL